ncbi:hypothetical protein ACIQCJ_21600 [Streptomyces sp. NPDC093221]|uniref:hypothetical protein n=1 Tax=unclassified Streptomyces TaxID=2593676 RepID=UPI0033B4880B
MAGTSTALVLFSGVGMQAAFADDSDTVGDSSTVHETPVDDVDESDAVDVPASQLGTEPDIPSTPPGGGNHPGGQYCDPVSVYTPTYKGGYHMRAVGPTQANTNATSRSMTSTFSSSTTGTVGVSLSGTLSTSVSVLIAKIETKYDVSLSSSLSVGFSNSSSITTPAHYTTFATYGVYRLRNQGVSYHYYTNCATTAHVTVTSYTPHHVGWYISESKN